MFLIYDIRSYVCRMRIYTFVHFPKANAAVSALQTRNCRQPDGIRASVHHFSFAAACVQLCRQFTAQ